MKVGTHLMTPAEVATLFGVDPKTVSRWAKIGRLRPVMTMGGHRRFRRSEVEAALVEAGILDAETPAVVA